MNRVNSVSEDEPRIRELKVTSALSRLPRVGSSRLLTRCREALAVTVPSSRFSRSREISSRVQALK